MTRVAVTGAAGRMGRSLIQAMHQAEDLTLAAALGRPGASFIGADAGEVAGVGRLGVAIDADLQEAATNVSERTRSATAP